MSDKPKRGPRPQFAGPGVRVTTWVSAQDYDRLNALANARPDRSVSGVLRDLAQKATRNSS